MAAMGLVLGLEEEEEGGVWGGGESRMAVNPPPCNPSITSLCPSPPLALCLRSGEVPVPFARALKRMKEEAGLGEKGGLTFRAPAAPGIAPPPPHQQHHPTPCHPG